LIFVEWRDSGTRIEMRDGSERSALEASHAILAGEVIGHLQGTYSTFFIRRPTENKQNRRQTRFIFACCSYVLAFSRLSRRNGYCSFSVFTAAFQKVMGEAPSAWRPNRLRSKDEFRNKPFSLAFATNWNCWKQIP